MDNIVPGIPVTLRKVPWFLQRTAARNTATLVKHAKGDAGLGVAVFNVDLRPKEVRDIVRKPVLSEDYLPGTWVERYHA